MALACSLLWRHNGRGSVSNHQLHDCLLNRLFRHRSKKTSKFRVTGLCAWNSSGTGQFPAQMASNAENVSIWWRHHIQDFFCVHGMLIWNHFKFAIYSITVQRATQTQSKHTRSQCEFKWYIDEEQPNTLKQKWILCWNTTFRAQVKHTVSDASWTPIC